MKQNPVLLIHGLFRKAKVFHQMVTYLSQRGLEIHRFDLRQDKGRLGLDRLAVQVADYVEKHLAPEQSFDIVGLSMGGLVSRYYLQRLGGLNRVDRLITISSPHWGTWMAYALPSICYVQMRPGSAFLQDLNRDIKSLQVLDFTSIWTPYDFIIVPGQSSLVPGGKNVKVSVFTHAMMVRDYRVFEAIIEGLSATNNGNDF